MIYLQDKKKKTHIQWAKSVNTKNDMNVCYFFEIDETPSS